MVIAYVLARRESDRGRGPIDWIALIEGGIFEFLHRVVLTDIKPPVFHKFMEDPEQRRKLNAWVAEQFRPDLESLPGDLDTLYTITDRVAVLSQKRVLVAAPITEVEDYDDPWIHDYFHGPRGRAAYEAATHLKEQ